MNLRLENTQWEMADDTAWYEGWVGLSSGDVYLEEQLFGTYLAAWYPNTHKPLDLLLTRMDRQPLEPVLTIALQCPVGDLEGLRAVGPQASPWGTGDGILSLTPTLPGEYSMYATALELFKLAPAIIQGDTSLRKYVLEPGLRIAEE